LSTPCHNNHVNCTTPNCCTETSLDAYGCRCADGFAGHNCDRNFDECLSGPCLNGGNCVDMIGDFDCDCLPGWTGVTCETDVDECALNPCEHASEYHGDGGSTCTHGHGTNDYRCRCKAGYSGTNCDVNIDECALNPCQNAIPDGCIDEVNRYRCECQDGWHGAECQHQTNPCRPRGRNETENTCDPDHSDRKSVV
jgi:hypothetical protein